MSHSRYGAVLDTCVLYPMPLADTLLRLAEQGLFRPFWSQETLNELEQVVISQGGKSASIAKRRTEKMHEAFPEALITFSGALVARALPDPEDEHVLAAAIISDAQAIVTANGKDFPAAVCNEFGIEVIPPDDFLVLQYDLDPNAVHVAILRQIIDTNNPPIGFQEMMRTMRNQSPKFAGMIEPVLKAEFRRALEVLSTRSVEVYEESPTE